MLIYNKKSSLNLSINAIVILILAITMLGLGLSFMRNIFGSATQEFQEVSGTIHKQMIDQMKEGNKEIDLSSAVYDIKSGEKKQIYIGFKNVANEAKNFTISWIRADSISEEDINCGLEDGDDVMVEYKQTPTTIQAGETVVLPMNLKVDSSTNKGTCFYEILIDTEDKENTAIYRNDEALVGYWSFDDGTAKDSSGGENDGTLYNFEDILYVKYGGYSGHAYSHQGLIDNYDYTDLRAKELRGEINIPTLSIEDYINFFFTTWFYVEEEGTWEFAIDGDDAVEAEIDSEVVASHYGPHGFCSCYTYDGSISLTKGWHNLIVRHDEETGGEGVKLYFMSPSDSSWQIFSKDNLNGKARLAKLTIPPDNELKTLTFIEQGIPQDYAVDFWTDGKISRAFDFDGTNDYIQGGLNDFAFEYSDPFSVELWAKWEATGERDIVGKMYQSSPYRGWNLQTYSNGLIRFTFINTWSSSYVSINTESSWHDGNWHHIVGTSDGTGTAAGMKIYIDGNLRSDINVQDDNLNNNTIVDTTNAHFRIGSRDGGGEGADFFDGIIDEVHIFSRALSEQEIQQLSKGGYDSSIQLTVNVE